MRLQLSSSVPLMHPRAEWLSLSAVPPKYSASDTGMGLPGLHQLGWEVWLGILVRRKRNVLDHYVAFQAES